MKSPSRSATIAFMIIAASASNAAASAFEDIVRERIAAEDSPACIAVGRVGDIIEETFACTSGAGPVPRRDSVFEIGSITKGLTGLLLADMVRKGEVSLDDAASKYSRAGAKLPNYEGREITLRDLVTHTSALPRLAPGFVPADGRNPYAAYDADALYAALERTTLARPIGVNAEYSNFGFMWLSEILARRAGKPYEALLKERVLDPLRMSDTAITLSGDQRKRVVTPHAAGYQPTPMWDFAGDLGGLGALRSTLPDMMKLGAALAGRGRNPMADTIALALAPMRPSESGNATGYGWITSQYGGELVRWHNGATAGSRAMIAVNPRTKTAAVVLVESAVSFDDLAMHLVDPTRPAKRKRVVLPTDAAARAQYAGTYQLAPGFQLEVFEDGERLMTRATGQGAIEIWRDGDDTFFTRGIDAQLVFHRKGDGTVGSVTLHQGGRGTYAPRVPGR